MASHMASQVNATSRNSQVEIFIDQLLKIYCKELELEGKISDFKVSMQSPYKSDFASDVWDHLVTFTDLTIKKKVELWCQTTCYKGHGDIKKREPNKSYEVKETLVEAISIRERCEQENVIFRTLHFTVGDSNYTYGWFKSLKSKSFDLSIYLDTEEENIFNTLNQSVGAVKVEFQVKKAITDLVAANAEFGEVFNDVIKQIKKWHIDDSLPIQVSAQQQWEIIKRNRDTCNIEKIIQNTSRSGLDIKKQVTDAIHKGGCDDPDIEKTVVNLLKKIPSITKLYETKENWEDYCSAVTELLELSHDLHESITSLWSNLERKEVFRRLLLRIHTSSGIDYIQDVDVEGISEHNLYGGTHNESQTSKLCDLIKNNLENEKITTTSNLLSIMTSTKAKSIVSSCLWFEAKNGTQIRPSFEYICIQLSKLGYKINKPKSLNDYLLGYHSNLTDETVKPYQNFKGVYDKHERLVAILKGKFFSKNEFPRRCKEEAFTGLTIQNQFIDGHFGKRHSIPIIMFVDMPKNLEPPHESLRRLTYFGWNIAFSVDEIKSIIANA